MAALLHSLRFKLLLAVGMVVIAAVTTVGYFSSRITSVEFHKFREMEELVEGMPLWPDGLAKRLVDYHAANGSSWDGVGALLAEVVEAEGKDRDFLLLDPAGLVLGVSTSRLRGATVEVKEGDGIRLTKGGEEGGQGRLELFFKAEGLPVYTLDGEGPGSQVGTVYSLPGLPPQSGFSLEDRFLLAVNRWLMAAVVASGILALAATYLLSRRIISPVESLTRAARRMEHGDLSQRVVVESGDEIGQLAAAFNSMADGLERIEDLRRRLVSDVAHELRTPLTGIRCQLESIQDGVVKSDARTLASLHEDVISLQRLVDDLQDLALAEAGRLTLERRPVDLQSEVEAAVRGLVPSGATPGEALVCAEVRLELDGLPAADVDPLRFRQIMRNLLSNAMTHTPESGEIAVTGRAENGTVEITIRDSGSGIAPEHLPNIFERFYRADPSRQRRTGGAGLGLAIVKQLVEAHGGKVRAESAPGHGASFILTLPAARDPLI